MQQWTLCGAVALAGLLGAGQALAASSPPFVDNGDGTVTDTSTGLMWDQCTLGQAGGSGGCTGGGTGRTWAAAMELSNMGHRGYSDWRVPGREELQSLLKADATGPLIDAAAFPATLSSGYWTSTNHVFISTYVWFVDFVNGYPVALDKTLTLYVRLVRSGQCFYPFSTLPVTVTAVGTTTAAFTATSSFATTGYWVVVARNAQAPTPAQIKAGNNSAGVAAVASGSVAMGAGSPASAVTGLTLGSQYDLYLWPEKAVSTIPGCVAMLPFATTAISTSAIVIDPVTPSKVYAALDGAGVYAGVSASGSTSWTAINSGLSNLNVRALALQNSSTLFAATYDGGVFKGTQSAGSWSWAVCDTGASLPTATRLRSLAVDASGNLLAGSETGVYQSTAACGGWAAMNTGMP